MSFAVIDFETANANRDSACAVGIALVDGSRISASGQWLIRPLLDT